MVEYPLITIGITCYNAQETIGRAIKSALTQDYPNFEIVIVDDCSADQSVEIVRGFSNKHDALHLYVQRENLGVAAARNRIIDEAKGEFIAFFDDDDVSQNNRLSVQYEAILKAEHDDPQNMVFCHCARLQIYLDGTQHYARTAGSEEGKPLPFGEAMAKRILIGSPLENGYGAMATCSQMARKQSYMDLGYFDAEFRRSEDTDFTVRAALSGAVFAGIHEPLVQQFMTLTTDKSFDDERFYTQKLYMNHKGFIEKFSSISFFKKWIDFKYDYIEGKRAALILPLISLMLTNPIICLKKILWSQRMRRDNEIFAQHRAGLKEGRP